MNYEVGDSNSPIQAIIAAMGIAVIALLLSLFASFDFGGGDKHTDHGEHATETHD